ncbi:MAG: c-type cytochrome, partial [Ginsengibacter sp.]
KVTGISNDVLAKKSIEKAASIAKDTSIAIKKRSEAIHFLALHKPAENVGLLEKLLVPQEHPNVQIAALQTLNLVPDLAVSKYILQKWPAMTPEIRDAALNTFMSNTDRMNLLLKAIETKQILPESLGWLRISSLLNQDNDVVRTKARSLLVNKDQEKINKQFETALKLKGDPLKGREIFKYNCALCHQVRGEIGNKFGPDLGTVQSWLAKDILANILDPNASIALGFDLWDVKMKTGESLQGIISSETSSAINLRTAPGKEQTINRQNIESITVTKSSAMPVLTSRLNYQQIADILAFLKQTK